MRTWTLPLLALLSSLSVAAQESAIPSETLKLDGLTIPVELTKSIKADKVHPGDPVQFKMAEAILAGNGVVLPAKAKLYGRVLAAGGRIGGNASFLSLLVERVEWTGHVLRLHAFVTGWGKKRVYEPPGKNCAARMATPMPRGRGGTPPSMGNPSAVFAECNQGSAERYEPAHWSHNQVIRDVSIYRDDADGTTVMMSKKNVRLPSGILLILQNNAEPSGLDAKR